MIYVEDVKFLAGIVNDKRDEYHKDLINIEGRLQLDINESSAKALREKAMRIKDDINRCSRLIDIIADL